MEITIPLTKIVVDFENIEIGDFEVHKEVSVYSSTWDLLVYEERNEEMVDSTIFSLSINFGKNKDKAIMCEVEMDELEEFATAVLNQIKIVRRNYSKQIQNQIDRGARI